MDKVKSYAMRVVDMIRAHPKTTAVVFVVAVLFAIVAF